VVGEGGVGEGEAVDMFGWVEDGNVKLLLLKLCLSCSAFTV
jgi:hypothetical protein